MHPYLEIAPIALVGGVGNVPRVRENPLQGAACCTHSKPIETLVAKGRARVGVAASVADWPKRIRDLQFLDHEGYAAAT